MTAIIFSRLVITWLAMGHGCRQVLSGIGLTSSWHLPPPLFWRLKILCCDNGLHFRPIGLHVYFSFDIANSCSMYRCWYVGAQGVAGRPRGPYHSSIYQLNICLSRVTGPRISLNHMLLGKSVIVKQVPSRKLSSRGKYFPCSSTSRHCLPLFISAGGATSMHMAEY